MCFGHAQRAKRGLPLTATLRAVRTPNAVTVEGDVAFIILTDRYGRETARTMIDAEDVERALAHRWRGHRGGKVGAKLYAHSHTGGFLHSFILPASDGEEIDHVNRDPLDNRKSNLRSVPHVVNAGNRGPRSRRRPSGSTGA